MTWVALITLASAAAAVAGTWTTARLASRDGQHAATVAVRGSTYVLRDGRTVRRRPHYRRAARRGPWWLFEVSPQRLTRLAILIAGRRGDDVCWEWRSHLAGETGAGWPEGRQVREAAGFVLAAVRYRLYDLAELLWRPAEALLASRVLSGLFVLLPTLCVSVLFFVAGGLLGLAEHLEDVAVLWGAAFGLIQAGRHWRDVKPPEHKPRRKKQ
jgi:hypothetical protein